MERNDDEQLWDLLDRAGTPQVSPFFARNVLREIRKQPRWRAAMHSWIAPRRLVPLAGAAAVVMAGVMWLQQSTPIEQAGNLDSDPIAKIDPQDYEVVTDLDDLLASEENNLWDDTSSL